MLPTTTIHLTHFITYVPMYSRTANEDALPSQYYIYTGLSLRGLSPDADNVAIASESVKDVELGKFREVSDIYYLQDGMPKVAMVKRCSALNGYGPTEAEPNPIQRLLNATCVWFRGYGGGDLYRPYQLPIDPVKKFRGHDKDESFWSHRTWFVCDSNLTFCILIPGDSHTTWNKFSYAPRKLDYREMWYNVDLTAEHQWWDLRQPYRVEQPHFLQTQRERLEAWNTALVNYPHF